jgi:dTDP-4-amino-4,6-dideoxygalactose transaminase
MKPFLGVEEQEAAADAVASGWVAQGPRVAEFEAAFAEALGAPHAVALSSCTTALHLALVVAGIGEGDEVVVPSLSFIATTNAVRYVGADPVFADVDLSTQNLTPATVEEVLTDRTRAVIAVDQGGMPVDLDALRELCEPRGIIVVEDAACGAGSTYCGRPVGATAEIAAFSFHPRKILTTGEGGMLTTTRPEWAERAALLRQHAMSMSAAERHAAGGAPQIERYLEVGFNYRMTDIQAAVGLVQLGRLAEVVERRRELADRYATLLGDIDGLALPHDPPWGTTNHQSYWVLLPPGARERRNDVMTAMGSAGISTRRGIMAAHLEPAYADHPHAPLPNTETLTNGSIILPLFHQLTDDDQQRVASALSVAIEECS